MGIEPYRKKRNVMNRAKTGCLCCKYLLHLFSNFSGRKRRVKCDEFKPSCRSCLRNSYVCVWPEHNGYFENRKEFTLQKLKTEPYTFIYGKSFKDRFQPPPATVNQSPLEQSEAQAVQTAIVGPCTTQVLPVSELGKYLLSGKDREMIDDALFREYLVTLCRDFRPTSRLNGFSTYMVGVDMTAREAMLYDAFVKGFMVSVSPQLTHRELQPAVVFIPPGSSNSTLRNIFYACGAAFLRWEHEEMNHEAEERFLKCMEQFPALVKSMKNSPNNQWLLICLLSLCLREKYDGHDYVRTAWYLQMALEVIRNWPAMQKQIVELASEGAQSQGLHTKEAPQIELALDDIPAMIPLSDKMLDNSERCLLESFLYNYSIILLLCDRRTLNFLESPFKIFNEFRPFLNQQRYNFPAPWMNNPVMGAALPAFEFAAKTSWLHATYPFEEEDLKQARKIHNMTKYYVAPVPPPSVRFTQPKHVQRKLLDSCSTARMVAKASYLLLTKLLNPQMSQNDPEIVGVISEMMKSIEELSIHSQTSFIMTWPIAVIGTVVTEKEHRDYLIWRLLNFGYAVRSKSHITIVEFLKKAWGTPEAPGPGWNVLLDKRYFKGMFL
ncbi:hypothetical protein KL936_002409 [Ogataea polymorpha]|nr:hypothetical protein KL936_002409 [Ogataea polymorpha]